MKPSLATGDRIIALASLLTTAAAFAGAFSCAIALWIIKRSVWWSVFAIVFGAIAGIGIGLTLGRFAFPAESGKVFVVKHGPEALPLTLKASLIGGVITGVILCVLPAGILGQSSELVLLAGVGCIVGLSIGVVFGYLSALA